LLIDRIEIIMYSGVRKVEKMFLKKGGIMKKSYSKKMQDKLNVF